MADRDLSEDEVADLKEAFAMFDINGDGTGMMLLVFFVTYARWESSTAEGEGGGGLHRSR